MRQNACDRFHTVLDERGLSMGEHVGPSPLIADVLQTLPVAGGGSPFRPRGRSQRLIQVSARVGLKEPLSLEKKTGCVSLSVDPKRVHLRCLGDLSHAISICQFRVMNRSGRLTDRAVYVRQQADISP